MVMVFGLAWGCVDYISSDGAWLQPQPKTGNRFKLFRGRQQTGRAMLEKEPARLYL